MHVPNGVKYKQLGFELVLNEEDWPWWPKLLPMDEEKWNYIEGDPIEMFLKESITQQWNVMMDYFTQILQQMLAASKGSSSRSSDFGEATLFKIYFNLDFQSAKSKKSLMFMELI